MRLVTVALSLIGLASPALANDTTAKLDAGGLIFVRSDAVEMASEDLYISPGEVRVDYEFRNRSEADVESIVAFPMPAIAANPYSDVSIPDRSSDNFLDFSVEVDGTAVLPALDQRAFAAEVDVTEELRANGVPLFPYAEAADAAISRLPDAVKADWLARGIVFVEEWDDGSGMKVAFSPAWKLKSTYWWKMRFPAGKPVKVRHRYVPSVGGTVGITFLNDNERRDAYRKTYCMDEAFERAVKKTVDKAGAGVTPYYENWISYVLTTGGNWATNIGSFRLTIDKGDADALVSFCGSGVRKTGPTTFEMTAENFYPSRDLDILILKKPRSE